MLRSPLHAFAAAQGLLLLMFLLNQCIKKKTFQEAAIEDNFQKARADRNGNDATAESAPAGSESVSFGNGHNIYNSSIRLQSV